MTDRRISPPSTILGVFRAKFLGLGRDEDGAALVITLAIFFLMYLGCMGVYAVSMAVKERIQLQNAADAAAYSAAVVQADTLSRIATINRAMSWTYVQMTREQMDYIVLRWLKHTVKHYNDDMNGADRYNKEGVITGPCGGHGSCGGGWFIGANPMGEHYKVRLNGLFVTSIMANLGFDLGPLSAVSGLVGIGSTPYIWDVETQLGRYEVSSAYKAISGGGISLLKDGASVLANTLREIEESDIDEPFSNLETAASVKAMMQGLSGVYGKYEGNGVGSEPLLQMRIAIDRAMIALMNVAERRLAAKMPSRIAHAVDDVIKANVPEYMAADCLYYLSQNDDPLDGEITGVGDGYFGNLYNNDTCERRFVAWSGYDGNLIETFMGMQSAVAKFLTSRIAAGLDQWFVRGNGSERTDNARGLQRCYKHWAEGPFSNIHMSHNPLPATCWNTDSDYLHNSPASIALYSEWAWWSECWWCPKILWKRRHYMVPHNPIKGTYKGEVSPWKLKCDHNKKPGLFGISEIKDAFSAVGDLAHAVDDMEAIVKGILGGRTDSDGNPIPIDESAYASPTDDAALEAAIQQAESQIMGGLNFDESATGGVGDLNANAASNAGISKFEDGCLILPPGLSGHPHRFVGFGRMYADAPQIYNTCYVGERAKPLVLRTAYFGKAGTISVGIRRKNENVFLRILNKIEGIFTAFDPDWNDGDDTHTYVFASAKAGYKDKGEDADSRQYKIDWQPNNQDWNLCQSDWDAVFVPVRKAYSYAIGGIWIGDDDEVLDDLAVNKASEWKSVAANGDGGYTYQDIYAPRGVLRGNGHNGTLKWRELSHVMFH